MGMYTILVLFRLLSAFSIRHDTAVVLGSYNIHTEQVTVSFYGDYFHGRITASGAVFDQWAMTCASPRPPLGTRLLCVHKKNKGWVTVTDRGPYATNEDGYAKEPLEEHPIRKLDMSKGSFHFYFGEWEVGVSELKIAKVELP